MEQKEFTIKALPELNLRVGKIEPTSLLAIAATINFDKYQQTQNVFDYALEHVEVKQGNQWVPVKVVGHEVYSPSGIEDNYPALNEIIAYFVNEVIGKVFQKSSE